MHLWCTLLTYIPCTFCLLQVKRSSSSPSPLSYRHCLVSVTPFHLQKQQQQQQHRRDGMSAAPPPPPTATVVQSAALTRCGDSGNKTSQKTSCASMNLSDPVARRPLLRRTMPPPPWVPSPSDSWSRGGERTWCWSAGTPTTTGSTGESREVRKFNLCISSERSPVATTI